MAYSETLADRIRRRLSELPDVEEKEMMGGLTFMYHNKMCVGVIKDELMCRIDPDIFETQLERNGCRAMDFTGKPMKGWIIIDETGMELEQDFNYWIELALAYNQKAQVAKKRRPR